MDKGLIKINELKTKLKELESKKLEKDIEIAHFTSEKTSLDCQIIDLKSKIFQLSDDKIKSELAPQQRKTEKVALIITFILSYVVISLIATLTIGISVGDIVSILKGLGTVSLLILGAFGIVSPIEFKSINKKYPIGNLAEIEKNISISDTQLQFLKSKEQELNTEITNLIEIKSDLESQIDEILKKIDSINNLRTRVIEEFCNNNSELDKKLDDAYDKSKVKEKVK